MNSESIVKKPKPFVKWVGGKRQLLAQFKSLDLYPPKEFDLQNNRYFEPFVGGGAVFFDLLPKNAFLFDLNSELITTYKVIKNNLDELIHDLKTHEINKEYFNFIRSWKQEDLTPIKIASRFIYLNKTCFNGLYRVNKKGNFNVSYGRYKKPNICDEKNLSSVSLALQNAHIECADYKTVLQYAKSGDFVYLDPPYDPLNKTSNFTSYTSGNFGQKEHLELREIILLLDKKGCFVMLSNSNTAFIYDVYSQVKNFTIHQVSANRILNSDILKRGKINEVVVKNY